MPPWAQAGITSLAAGQALLDALRRDDTLALPASDGDVGYPLTALGHERRGQGAGPPWSVVAASQPEPNLLAYHRELGLAPAGFYVPSQVSHAEPLAAAALADAALVERIRADRSLTRIFVAFKDANAERLIALVGLEPVLCAPPASAYEAANDKLAFVAAAAEHGFPAVPMVSVSDLRELGEAFESLDREHRRGCILRRRRGAGGHGIHRAKTLALARRLWRRLRADGEVAIAPFVPAERVLRDVAVHGVMTADGFASLAFSDQIVRRFRFRGGRVGDDWTADEIAAVDATLRGVGRWLGDLGYVDAPAGVDGFLMRWNGALRFVALDPNIRLTGTILPWAVVATLSEAAGRKFVWEVETYRVLGRRLDFGALRRRLGKDLLSPDRVELGGILPSVLSATLRVGPLAASHLRAILIGRDRRHLDRLRSRIGRLGIVLG